MNEKKLEVQLEWEKLPFPELVVGEATKEYHTGDTAYWRYADVLDHRKKIAMKKIHSIGENGLIFLKTGLLPFGSTVKIECPHK